MTPERLDYLIKESVLRGECVNITRDELYEVLQGFAQHEEARAKMAAVDALIANPRAFQKAWAKKRAAGYQYGRDALEGVRFGFEIATEELAACLKGASALEEKTK